MQTHVEWLQEQAARDRQTMGGVMLRVFVPDRIYSILCAVSERTGRSVEDLAEAGIAEEAIRSLPPSAR